MLFGQRRDMEMFMDICEKIIPERVSLITNYGDWENRIVMRGPHLNVSLLNQAEDDVRIRSSEERGMTVEVPCEGVEIVEVLKTKWEFEAHIYFLTFDGFARINIIGRPNHLATEEFKIEKKRGWRV